MWFLWSSESAFYRLVALVTCQKLDLGGLKLWLGLGLSSMALRAPDGADLKLTGNWVSECLPFGREAPCVIERTFLTLLIR